MFTESQQNQQEDNIATKLDLHDWVYEHYCMADFLNSIEFIKEMWLPQNLIENTELDTMFDEEWAIASEMTDIFKANCLDKQWEYVKNYLVA